MPFLENFLFQKRHGLIPPPVILSEAKNPYPRPLAFPLGGRWRRASHGSPVTDEGRCGFALLPVAHDVRRYRKCRAGCGRPIAAPTSCVRYGKRVRSNYFYGIDTRGASRTPPPTGCAAFVGAAQFNRCAPHPALRATFPPRGRH